MRSSTGVTPVIGVVGFVTLVASLSVGVHLLLLGAEPAAYPPHLSGIVSLPFSAAMFLGTWGVLRYEGGSLAAIGLGKSALVPAILMFGLFWGIVTAGGVVYLLAAGASGELGAAVGMPWYWVPVWLALMLTLSNGLTEEFVFRGYIQNKCTAVVESHSRLPAAVGSAV